MLFYKTLYLTYITWLLVCIVFIPFGILIAFFAVKRTKRLYGDRAAHEALVDLMDLSFTYETFKQLRKNYANRSIFKKNTAE